MFGRRKRQQENIDEAEKAVLAQVLRTARDITFPGAEITPEIVMQAAQMTGQEVILGAMEGGASARDCSLLMAKYLQVGERAALMFAPGGPLYGATSPDIDER